MKSLLILFLALASQAQGTVLVKAPQADANQYNSYLRSNPTYSSYIDSLVQEQIDPQAEQRLFQLADSKHSSFQSFSAAIEKMKNEGPLSSWAWSFISDFIQSHPELVKNQEDAKLQSQLQCESAFYQGLDLAESCVIIKLPLTEIRQRWPAIESVLLGQRHFSVDETIAVPLNKAYRWTLLSNSHQAIRFHGDFAQLLQQNIEMKPLIHDDSDELTANSLPEELRQRGRLYIDSRQVLPLNELREKSWFQENWKWLSIPATILVIGVVTQLQDKALVIKSNL